MHRQLLLRRLPDEPRWVELRGLLLCGRGLLLHVRGPDFLVLDPAGPGLLCVGGAPPAARLRQAAARLGPHGEILAVPEGATAAAAALPDWRPARAILHRLDPGRERLPDPGTGVRLLRPDEAPLLAHLPDPPRAELLRALRSCPLAAAFVRSTPVSFCYAGPRTEGLWDVAIDTLEPYRRRGLAARTAAFLIRQQRRQGRQPVWGAVEDNVASLGLAAHLGFVEVDRLVVFTRRPAGAAP